MLMQEKVSKAGLQGRVQVCRRKRRRPAKWALRTADLRDRLVIIPQIEDPNRIPFSEIETVTAADYALT